MNAAVTVLPFVDPDGSSAHSQSTKVASGGSGLVVNPFRHELSEASNVRNEAGFELILPLY